MAESVWAIHVCPCSFDSTEFICPDHGQAEEVTVVRASLFLTAEEAKAVIEEVGEHWTYRTMLAENAFAKLRSVAFRSDPVSGRLVETEGRTDVH